MAETLTPLTWVDRGGRWYAANTVGAFDGDDAGHEWPIGWSVLQPVAPANAFELYEDDGHGNGDFVAVFLSRWAAQRHAAKLNARLVAQQQPARGDG